MTDKVARVVMAIQKAGDDHLGPVRSVQQDFIDILMMIPEERRQGWSQELHPLPTPPKTGFFEKLKAFVGAASG